MWSLPKHDLPKHEWRLSRINERFQFLFEFCVQIIWAALSSLATDPCKLHGSQVGSSYLRVCAPQCQRSDEMHTKNVFCVQTGTFERGWSTAASKVKSFEWELLVATCFSFSLWVLCLRGRAQSRYFDGKWFFPTHPPLPRNLTMGKRQTPT